jgi:uncharacterized lipoprotein YmbA
MSSTRIRAGRLAGGLFLLIVCGGLTGCLSFLKPAQSTARYYVLTPTPGMVPVVASPNSLDLGLGRVKLPAYLLTTSLAVRKGANEVEYIPTAVWAERLDTGFQRVLAANLCMMLPTDRVHLSAWERQNVGAELYVALEQFDVNDSGEALLVVRWRILSPGGEQILKVGRSRLTQQGPVPEVDPSGAISTLSSLVADFSRQMVLVLQEMPGQPTHAAR